MFRKLIILLLFTLFGFYIGYQCGLAQPTVIETIVEIELPMSVQSTQLLLIEAGYDIEADNKWGPITEQAYCDYMAQHTRRKMSK